MALERQKLKPDEVKEMTEKVFSEETTKPENSELVQPKVDETVKINILLPKIYHHRLKSYCNWEKKSMQDIALQAVIKAIEELPKIPGL